MTGSVMLGRAALLPHSLAAGTRSRSARAKWEEVRFFPDAPSARAPVVEEETVAVIFPELAVAAGSALSPTRLAASLRHYCTGGSVDVKGIPVGTVLAGSGHY